MLLVAGCKHTVEGASKDLESANRQIDQAQRDATKQLDQAQRTVDDKTDEVKRRAGGILNDASRAINHAGTEVAKGVEKAADESSKAINKTANEASKAVNETAQRVGDTAKDAYDKTKKAVDSALLKAKIEMAIMQDTILGNKNNQIEIKDLATKIVITGMVMTIDMKNLASKIADSVAAKLKSGTPIENQLYVPHERP